jgi:hypothetical protein
MTLQFKRKYSTQGSGAPCHMSFGFFSPDFSGFSCQDFRWTLSQSLRLSLRLGGYSIWSAILQSHLHIGSGFKTRQAFFEDLRRQYSRTLGTTREDFKIAQTSAGVHSSLGMLRLLLRTFDLKYSGTLEDYSLRLSRLLEAILLDYKVLEGLSYGPPWAHYLGGCQD